MASVLDLGILSYLTPLFVFFFVFLIFYALFERFKVLGENRNIHGLVSFVLALLFVLVADLRGLLGFVVPIFVLFFIVLIIILIGVMLLGFTYEDISKYIRETPSIIIAVVVIILVIFFFGIATFFPDIVGYPSGGESGFSVGARRLLFHPKVLGAGFILVFACFLVRAVGYFSKK